MAKIDIRRLDKYLDEYPRKKKIKRKRNKEEGFGLKKDTKEKK
tara:strand:+ start:70 stop:198 length:129 start_codon:yes stop_codon:yes gene_type:complete